MGGGHLHIVELVANYLGGSIARGSNGIHIYISKRMCMCVYTFLIPTYVSQFFICNVSLRKSRQCAHKNT